MRAALVMILTLLSVGVAYGQSFSRWQYLDQTDPFTDEMQLAFGVESVGSVRGEVVLAGCTGDLLFLSLDDGGFNIDESTQVQIRVDENEAWSFRGIHTRGGGYVAYDETIVRRFLEEVRDGQTELIYRAGSRTVHVPLRGSTAAATEFLAECPHLN